jgi:hypothetical protein
LNSSLEELQVVPNRGSDSNSMKASFSSFEEQSTNLQQFSDYNNLKNDNPGMKNVTQWLKNIKLHKYTCFFVEMTYEELIGLNEQKMIEANITLGARKKILNCIDKIKERPVRLSQLIQVKLSILLYFSEYHI